MVSAMELVEEIVQGIHDDWNVEGHEYKKLLPPKEDIFKPVVGFPHVVIAVDDQAASVVGRNREATSEQFIWASGRIISEPQIRTFNALLKEFTVIVLYMQVPGDQYSILEKFDREILRRIKISRRLVNTTRVTDLLGLTSGTLARERTVIIR